MGHFFAQLSGRYFHQSILGIQTSKPPFEPILAELFGNQSFKLSKYSLTHHPVAK